MASGRGREEDNGPISWILLSVCVVTIIGTLVWFVGSTYIVFYLTPLFYWMGHAWWLIPTDDGREALRIIGQAYVYFRYHSASVSFGNWVDYLNLCLKPYAGLWIPVATWLFFRVRRHIRRTNMSDRMTAERLAANMMSTFSDIAPVVRLQKKLVEGSLKAWRRQVFPVETLQRARHQKRPVLVLDAKTGKLKVDHARLDGYLRATRHYKDHQGTSLLESHLLGRQIVDFKADGTRKDLAVPDRLSPTGKAIFAVLAPYAFGGAKGKKQSEAVKDALNYSAYGSPTGSANLDLDEVQTSFDQWRTNPIAQKISRLHHWENTYLYALLRYARRNGKVGTWSTLWLKPMNRTLFYVLNTEGRATPHSESALAFSQFEFEERCGRQGLLPIDRDKNLRIFTDKTIASYETEWTTWQEGDDPDSEKWWQADAFDPVASLNNVDLKKDLECLRIQPKPEGEML